MPCLASRAPSHHAQCRSKRCLCRAMLRQRELAVADSGVGSKECTRSLTPWRGISQVRRTKAYSTQVRPSRAPHHRRKTAQQKKIKPARQQQAEMPSPCPLTKPSSQPFARSSPAQTRPPDPANDPEASETGRQDARGQRTAQFRTSQRHEEDLGVRVGITGHVARGGKGVGVLTSWCPHRARSWKKIDATCSTCRGGGCWGSEPALSLEIRPSTDTGAALALSPNPSSVLCLFRMRGLSSWREHVVQCVMWSLLCVGQVERMGTSAGSASMAPPESCRASRRNPTLVMGHE